jgi:hypothetical protein
MKIQPALVLSALAATSAAVQGQIASWSFENSPLGTSPNISTGTTYSLAATFGSGTATGVHASSATQYSSPTGNGSAKAFSSNTWAVGDYYQFQVDISALGSGSFTVVWDHTGSNTGPKNFDLQYSTASDFSSPTTLTSYTITNDGWSASAAKPVSTHQGDTGVANFSAFSAVYFRLVDTASTAISGSPATGGTSRIDNFTVAFTPVPEPGEYAAMFAGGLVVFGLVRRQLRK